MNISTAAHYLKIGYRIRRASWEPEECVTECAGMLSRREVRYYNLVEAGSFTKERYVSEGVNADLGLEDLLADDWEIITTNIRKQFNKYGNFEYDDETDWDNYEPKYNSWGDEDEDE
jgi:predicted methyltransferase